MLYSGQTRVTVGRDILGKLLAGRECLDDNGVGGILALGEFDGDALLVKGHAVEEELLWRHTSLGYGEVAVCGSLGTGAGFAPCAGTLTASGHGMIISDFGIENRNARSDDVRRARISRLRLCRA